MHIVIWLYGIQTWLAFKSHDPFLFSFIFHTLNNFSASSFFSPFYQPSVREAPCISFPLFYENTWLLQVMQLCFPLKYYVIFWKLALAVRSKVQQMTASFPTMMLSSTAMYLLCTFCQGQYLHVRLKLETSLFPAKFQLTASFHEKTIFWTKFIYCNTDGP